MAPRRRRRLMPLMPLLFQQADGSGFNATAQRARSKRELTKIQRLGTRQWMRYQYPNTSVLVQIGANNHNQSTSYDPGPFCVRRGWRSVLIEPVPQIFAALQRRYQNAARVQYVL